MSGPCSWNIVFNDCCDCWDGLDPGTQERALAYATTVLWAATGRQFDACPQTVRPCGVNCEQGYWAGQYWFEGTWVPYLFNGQWRNCWCGLGSDCCTCAPRCQVYLPGPVIAVSEVVQDGILVPASAWRVDNNRWLVRTDGQCWPYCQDFNVDAGLGVFNDNTLQVTYTRGVAVPTALLNAAATVACEFAKACTGQACRLPGRLSTVARQGVQLTFQDIDTLIETGFTGIPEVDQIIAAYNPFRLMRPMRVYSPDLPVTRQVTIP